MRRQASDCVDPVIVLRGFLTVGVDMSAVHLNRQRILLLVDALGKNFGSLPRQQRTFQYDRHCEVGCGTILLGFYPVLIRGYDMEIIRHSLVTYYI